MGYLSSNDSPFPPKQTATIAELVFPPAAVVTFCKGGFVVNKHRLPPRHREHHEGRPKTSLNLDSSLPVSGFWTDL